MGVASEAEEILRLSPVHRVALAWLMPLALLISARSQGQAVGGTASSTPVELTISGPLVIHVGENLQFTATLTNRSTQVIAVPAIGSQDWIYMVGEWWKIADKSGRLLRFKPPTDQPYDHMVGMPILRDSDFILLKPGEKIEYGRETLGDPSDRFLFPRRGTYFVSLSWKFCAPNVQHGPSGATGYNCGITKEMSQSVREVVLATPSFDVQSNV